MRTTRAAVNVKELYQCNQRATSIDVAPAQTYCKWLVLHHLYRCSYDAHTLVMCVTPGEEALKIECHAHALRTQIRESIHTIPL